jgi:hypothetical protein
MAHLHINERVGVKVMGQAMAHPPVSVRQQRQIEEVSPPSLQPRKKGFIATKRYHLSIYENITTLKAVFREVLLY